MAAFPKVGDTYSAEDPEPMWNRLALVDRNGKVWQRHADRWFRALDDAQGYKWDAIPTRFGGRTLRVVYVERAPLRQHELIPADAEEPPHGSVVVDRDENAWQRFSADEFWHAVGFDGRDWDGLRERAPLTLIYLPTS